MGARLVGPRVVAGTWPAEYHRLLGHVVRPGYCSPEGAPQRVCIEADGLRSNGGAHPPGRPIVAVGDSFAFGEEVADEHTWPAFLERELRVPVLNGGVPAYGFDQTVLRAEMLLASRDARGLIVALILDDADRCEYSVLNRAPKPFFDVTAGGLELRNVPVPRPLATRPPLAALLRYSRLAFWIRQAATPWERREHRRGLEVTNLLIRRLGARARSGPPVLLLIQGPPGGRALRERLPGPTFPTLRGLEQAAADNGLVVLNLVAAAWAEIRAGRVRRKELFLHGGTGHMSPAGNAWVAAHLAHRLRSLGWVDGGGGDPSSVVDRARDEDRNGPVLR